MIFNLPLLVTWIIFLRNWSFPCEIIFFASATDEHPNGLRPSEKVLAIELVAGDKKSNIFRGSRISRIWNSRCLIRIRRDFRDGVVCSSCHAVLDYEGQLGMEARVFQRTDSDTMKILRKNNLLIFITSVEEYYILIYMILMTKKVTNKEGKIRE